MGALIAEASQSKPKPQLIVVATDGWTPWGEPVGIPVVACITGRMPTTAPPACEEKVSGLFSGELSSDKIPRWEDQNVQTKRAGFITH
jgi:hypothetical protein